MRDANTGWKLSTTIRRSDAVAGMAANATPGRSQVCQLPGSNAQRSGPPRVPRRILKADTPILMQHYRQKCCNEECNFQ
jgi:hypothetical protein